MKRVDILLLTLIGLVVFAAGCGSGELTVKEAWARPALAGKTGEAYFVIDNRTGQKDTLLDVRSEVSDKVEVHLTAVDENGVASMEKQDSVAVLHRESVAFEPGGLHVMLINLRKDLAPGDTFQLTLVFKERGEIVVEVPVQSP